MTHIEQLEKLLNAKITEDFSRNPELSIYTQSTADGYDVYIITSDVYRIDWENDIYYYEPSFEDIVKRIKEVDGTVYCSDNFIDDPIIVYCSDIEQFFNEYEVEDYIERNKDNEDDN